MIDDVEVQALIIKALAAEGTDTVLFVRISGNLLVSFLVLGELLQPNLTNLSKLWKLLNKSSNFASIDCTDKNTLISWLNSLFWLFKKFVKFNINFFAVHTSPV